MTGIQIFDMIRLLLAGLMTVAVLLPLVRSDYWVFRILEYPRFQKFILCCVVLAMFVFRWQPQVANIVAVIALVVCTLFLFYKILPYTRFSRKEMKTVSRGKKESAIRVFAANVYRDNRRYHLLLDQIRKVDPDIVFLVETDDKWLAALKILEDRYPFRIYQPLQNTYGLAFFSRLPFRENTVRYLVEKDVPSIYAVLQLRSGEEIRIWGLHPKPPVPGEDIRSTAKDKELMLVAGEAKESELPVIVMGDLNDVAWSYTTELFRKTSRLLDPRRGRGFYSTYNARNFLFRFPLDYIFCSNDFGLVSMKRLPRNGSDHFAMFTELQYDPSLRKKQSRPHADRQEKKAAERKMQTRG